MNDIVSLPRILISNTIRLMNLAPIVIFAFNRPGHLSNLFTSLLTNPEAQFSKIYLFIDGPRSSDDNKPIEATRKIGEQFSSFLNITIFQNEKNIGLSESILGGIDKVLLNHDRVIVLEDDLELSSNFLSFINRGLEVHTNDLSVASIQGFSLIDLKSAQSSYFLRGADCWGWATWSNRWDSLVRDPRILLDQLRSKKLTTDFDLNGAYPYTNMLERNCNKAIDSWAIRWHASMFLEGKVSLYPAKSLVRNMGRDGSGTHGGSQEEVEARLTQEPIEYNWTKPEETPRIVRKLRRKLRSRYRTYTVFDPRKYFAWASRTWASRRISTK